MLVELKLILSLVLVPVVPITALFPDKGLVADEAGENFDGDVLAGVRTHLTRQVVPLAAQLALQKLLFGVSGVVVQHWLYQ